MEPSKHDATARRRAQNRLAQRRFRWKQNQQKTAAAAPQQRRVTDAETQKQSYLAANGDNDIDNGNDHNNDRDNNNDNNLEDRARANAARDRPSPSIFNLSAADPVKACRFSLFGNPALLGGFESMEDDLTTSILNFPMAEVPNNHAKTAAEVIMPTPGITPVYSHSHSGMAEILQNFTPESIFSSPLPPKQTTPGEIEMQGPQLSHTTSITALSSLQATNVGQSKIALNSNTPFSPRGNSPGSKASKNWRGPLHLAAQKGHERIVRMLLGHVECNEKDSDGQTPLYHAIVGGHEGTVTCLIEHGAQVEQVDNQGRSALHVAILERRESVLRLLLDHFDGNETFINCYDSSGLTPLLTAIDTGFDAGVQLLLQYGANADDKARKS